MPLRDRFFYGTRALAAELLRRVIGFPRTLLEVCESGTAL